MFLLGVPRIEMLGFFSVTIVFLRYYLNTTMGKEAFKDH
jgi:hypothetical protein